MQLYNKFIDFCNSLMTHITIQRLVYGALIAVGVFVLLSIIINSSSAASKFCRKCAKFERVIRKHGVNYQNMNAVDPYCKNISRGFFHGWNKFKKSEGKRPSDFLTKREVLDSEVATPGQTSGKSFLKVYIAITTILLFIINLAFVGKDLTLTFAILVEAMFLPFVYYVITSIFYLFVCLDRQGSHKAATAHYYKLIDSLDRCFEQASEHQPVFETKKADAAVVEDDENGETELALVAGETKQEETQEAAEEPQVEETEDLSETQNSEVEETEQMEEFIIPTIEELLEQIGEVEAENSQTDEEAKGVGEEIQEEISQFETSEAETEEEVGLDETNSEIEEVQAAEEIQTTEETQEEPAVRPVARDWEAEQNLDYYDVFKKKNINVDKYINEIPNESDGAVYIDVDQGFVPSDDMASLQNETETENVVAENEALTDLQDQDEIEPEEAPNDGETIEEEITDAEEDAEALEIQDENFDIEQESISIEEEDETENVDDFDFFNDAASRSETEVEIEPADDGEEQQNNFKSQIEQNLNDSTKEIDDKLVDSETLNIDLSALVGEFKQNYQEDEEPVEEEVLEPEIEIENPVAESENAVDEAQNQPDDQTAKEIFAKINDLENLINSAIGKTETKPQKETKSTKKTKKGKTKMTENETTKKTRGRPKMQTIDENLKITNEEEFEDILARAEKLMRKSEQGLSASQSKRIEKELKIMMDAMNKYKEGK